MVTQVGSSSTQSQTDRRTEPSRDRLGDNFGVAMLFNFREGEFVLSNGLPIISDEVQAVMQWITNTLITEKGVYAIHTPNYGTYIYGIQGKGFPRDALTLMIPDMIEEDLVKDSRIQAVGNFNINYENENMFINFDVYLVNGFVFNFDHVWVL